MNTLKGMENLKITAPVLDRREVGIMIVKELEEKHDERRLTEHIGLLQPDAEKTDSFLSMCLIEAANNGSSHAVKILLQNGAENVMERTNDYGNSALITAAIKSHSRIISHLLKAGCVVNRTDQESRTALHWVAMNGNADSAQELLDNGSMPDHADDVYGFTPLMLAARQGHGDIVKLLLNYDCDIHREDIHRETPLFDAVRNNNIECVYLLLEAGANVDHLNKRGITPLHTAVFYNRTKAMLPLIYYNCMLDSHGSNYITDVSCTPLESAVLETKEEACKILVKAGADLRCLYGCLNLRSEAFFDSELSVRDWILQVLDTQPRSLKELCRIAIRRFYCRYLWTAVDNLPLPAALRTYLTLPELFEEAPS